MCADPTPATKTWTYKDTWAGVQVRFCGRGPVRTAVEARDLLYPAAPPAAWARQAHSNQVLRARGPGECGEADALIACVRELTLAVQTADCVPILLAGPKWVTAVHAGWRGLTSGVIRSAVEAGPNDLEKAWIGPSIGPCCYEVGLEVAEQVVANTGAGGGAIEAELVHPGPHGKPHLDLQVAAQRQLESQGLDDVQIIRHCTHCHPQDLCSYRRDGKMAGRNFALIWRS